MAKRDNHLLVGDTLRVWIMTRVHNVDNDTLAIGHCIIDAIMIE